METRVRYAGKRHVNYRQWIFIIGLLIILLLEPKTYISFYTIDATSRIGLIGLVLFVFIVKGRPIVFNSTQLLIAISFTVLLLYNKLITGDSSAFTFSLIISIAFAFLFSQVIPKHCFAEIYTKTLLILCIYSLIATYTVITFNGFFSGILPSFIHHHGDGMLFLNAGLTNVYVPALGLQFRNFGIFSEPGVYQLYIGLALILEIWYVNLNKYRSLRITIYIVTLMSTFSLSGMLFAVLIALSVSIEKSGFNREVKTKTVICMLALFLLSLYYVNTGFGENINRALTKLSGGGSYDSRVGSFWAYVQAWAEKPFVGWGYGNGISLVASKYLSLYTEHNTNTIVTNFALFGLFYGSIYFSLLTMFFWTMKANIIAKVLVLIAVMLSTNSQRFIDSMIIFILLFYSVEKGKNDASVGKVHKIRRLLR